MGYDKGASGGEMGPWWSTVTLKVTQTSLHRGPPHAAGLGHIWVTGSLAEVFLWLLGVSVLRRLQSPGSVCWNGPELSFCHIPSGQRPLSPSAAGLARDSQKKREEARGDFFSLRAPIDIQWSPSTFCSVPTDLHRFCLPGDWK